MKAAHRIVVGSWILASAAACDSSGSAAPDDGVSLENSRTEIESAPVWRWAAEPDVRIGAAAGPPEELFGYVAAAGLGPEGIYVLDGGNKVVRVFSRDGQFLRSIGGEGEGPGELVFPRGLVVRPDSTVLVWDSRQRRVTWYVPDGSVPRIATVYRRLLNPSFYGVLPDGSFVVSDEPPSLARTEGSEATGEIHLLRFSSEGELVDTLATLRGRTTLRIGRTSYSKPYAAPDLAAAAPDGGVWIIRTDTAVVARLDTAGDVVRAFAWEALAREVARADIDAYVDAFLPSAGQDPDRRQEIEQLRDPDLAASRHPSAIDLRTDALGRIWVAERRDWDRLHGRTWLIFDPEGRLLARMEPTDDVLDVLDADETHVLLRFTDELGVQGVELRRITVTRAGAAEP